MVGPLFAIFMLFVAGAWFWCSFVFITQDHRYKWIEMVLWVLISNILRAFIKFPLSTLGFEAGGLFASLVSIPIGAVFLYIILRLRYRVESPKDSAKILGVFYGGLLIPMFATSQF